MLAGATQTDSGDPGEQDEPGLPVVGEVVAGKYLVERRLGSGGMGIVVAARNILLDDQVAIKFLRPSAATDEESVHRFVREAKSARRIQSEHVVRVQDVSYLEIGTPYMIMELLEGEDLSQLVESRGVLSVANAVDLICEACAGIAEAHALGIVHRDIKPANMFLARRNDGSRVVKVLDFGISKAMDSGQHANPNMTDTRATFGSPTYMSPEQIRSSKKVDFRTDIWAIGVCLHEVLTARPPFLAETVAGLLASIIADAPIPIRQERPDIPAGLETVILQCLEKDLNRRYQTIGDLVAALRPFATASSEGSISRVLRLSPQSYPRTPSISPDLIGAHDSYRALSSQDPSRPASAAYPSQPLYPSSHAPVLAAGRAASSSAAMVHARTDRNFNTSSSVTAPPNATSSSNRGKAKVVAALVGVLTLGAIGVSAFVVRHRLVGPPANATGATSSGEATVALPDPSSGAGTAAAPSLSVPASGKTEAAAVTPTAPGTGSASVPPSAPSSPPPPSPSSPAPATTAHNTPPDAHSGTKGASHATPTKGRGGASADPGAAAVTPAAPAPAPSTPHPPSKEDTLNGQF